MSTLIKLTLSQESTQLVTRPSVKDEVHDDRVSRKGKASQLTQIHWCLRASAAVMRLAGFIVSIELMRFFASEVTVSHSGAGY